MKILYLFLFVCLIPYSPIQAQEKKTKNIEQIIYYSFTNASSIEQVNKLKADVEGLKNVVKVKVEYKPEKAAGQIITITKQTIQLSEDSEQDYFDVRDLKRLISENGLMPNQITIEALKK